MIEIRTEGGETAFAPKATLRGDLQWMCDAAPETIRLRLLWYTEGRGDRDVGIAEEIPLGAPVASGSSPFRFTLPSGPYSCSGQLVSVRWAIEAVSDSPRDVGRLELVLGPDRREVVLGEDEGD
ncbi:MAG: hypothetical protein AAF430_07440 [Myxococcota bacterium]